MAPNSFSLVDVLTRLENGKTLQRTSHGRYTIYSADEKFAIIGFVSHAVMVSAVGKGMIRGRITRGNRVEYALTPYGVRYMAHVHATRAARRDSRKHADPVDIQPENTPHDKLAEVIERAAIATGD